MQIVDNKALKLTLPHDMASTVINKVFRSERCADKDILVAWEQPEAEYLTYLMDQVKPHVQLPLLPSPMLRDYSWPTVFPTIFDHQKTTASFLSVRHRAFCFNEAGTAKSASVIWAADYLMNLGLIKRVLVICPMSVMYTVWQSDIMKTAMHRTVGVAYGDKEYRNKILQAAYDFTVINYDGVAVVSDEIGGSGIDLVVVDEANAYKNSTTKRWKTLAKLLKPSTRLWMMTGTPAAHSPVDAFGLARLVSPERVPKFKTAWRDVVMQQRSRFVWLPKPDAKEKVFKALQPAIRFTKKECLDLPDIVYETRDVPLSPQVFYYYKKLKREMLIEAAGEEISAVNAAAGMSKLLQISGGAVYTDGKDVVEFDVSPRLAVLHEILEEANNKVIIFVPFLHTIKVITDFLVQMGYSNSVIRGNVIARDRADIINRFQRGIDPRILIIQPQAASHGVTLTAADTIVFWGPVLSAETYMQCCGRINRVGQTNKMLVVHLQGSEAERRVYSMLQSKIDGHIKLVDMYKEILNG